MKWIIYGKIFAGDHIDVHLQTLSATARNLYLPICIKVIDGDLDYLVDNDEMYVCSHSAEAPCGWGRSFKKHPHPSRPHTGHESTSGPCILSGKVKSLGWSLLQHLFGLKPSVRHHHFSFAVFALSCAPNALNLTTLSSRTPAHPPRTSIDRRRTRFDWSLNSVYRKTSIWHPSHWHYNTTQTLMVAIMISIKIRFHLQKCFYL
jgi:hypothetical protein